MEGCELTADMETKSAPVEDDATDDELSNKQKWLSLTEFYEQYKNSLPVKAKFCHSGQSVEEPSATINILSTVQEEITELQMEGGGEKWYTAVQNNSVQYGLLYNPNNKHKLEEAIKGLSFATVERLMAQPQLPHFICATKAHTGETAECSVGKGEVLLVQKITQSRTSFFKSEALKSLSVYSVTANQKKKLLPNCAGAFTTMPYLTKLHLSEIYSLVPNLRSFKAVVFVQSNNIALPSHLSARVATLTPCGVGVCLCATVLGDEKGDNYTSTVPIRSPLKFRVLLQKGGLPLPQPLGTVGDRKVSTSCNSLVAEYQYMQAAALDGGTSDYEDVSFYARTHAPAVLPSVYNQPFSRVSSGDIHAKAAEGRSNCSSDGVDLPEVSGGVEVPEVSNASKTLGSNQTEVVELRQMVLELQGRCDVYERRMEDMAEQIEHLQASHKHSVEAFSTALEKLSLQISHQSGGTGHLEARVGSVQEDVLSSSEQVENRNALQKLSVSQVRRCGES